MHYIAQRIGLRIPAGLIVVLVIVVAVVGAAFWIGPFRPLPPEVQLLAAGAAGFGEDVSLANAGTDEEPRFPLVLALRNQGRRDAHPTALHVSVPATWRLHSARYELRRETLPGNPLVRYTLPMEPGTLEPGTPRPLTALDTLWLEPRVSDYTCTTTSDSIPEFSPAPRIAPERLADVRTFYSIGDARFDTRATGVLRVRLDAAALTRPTLPRPPAFPAEVREPMVPAPAIDALAHAGARTSLCGDLQQPLELFTSTWVTPSGGRLLVVYVNGAPRKQLYDLNRDSIVELELWDPDADGRFEARRAARFPIPEFLLPERPAEMAVAIDSLANDPNWQFRLHDIASGPFRFVPDSLRPPLLSMRPAPVDTATPAPTGAVTGVTPARATAPDTAWLRRFHDTAAGPYRFAADPPPRLVQPPRPQPRRTEPLGTPVPYPEPD